MFSLCPASIVLSGLKIRGILVVGIYLQKFQPKRNPFTVNGFG